MPHTSSISDAIIHDHEELNEYYEKYKSALGAEEQDKYANQFRWELARHSVGEELVLYPLYEKYMGEEGKKLYEEDRADHQLSKEQLYKLQNMKVTDPEHEPLFDTLMADLRKHIKSEEEKDLPLFESKISREESKSLAESFHRTKMFVPTYSHPGAPDQPPFETIVGLLAAPIDMLRDMFASFPSD